MPISKCVCVCVCVCVWVAAHMPIHAPNMLVYFAMVCDGPTTLGLGPQNKNQHLARCSEWVRYPYLIQTNTQRQARVLAMFSMLGYYFHEVLTNGGPN